MNNIVQRVIIQHYRKNEYGELRLYRRNFHPFKPQTKGGKTYCKILTEDEQFVGFAYCSDKDNYCYKIGRELAFERAKQQMYACHPDWQE